MNVQENILTACEEVIMKAIWNADDDITTQDLIEVLRTQHGKDYARTTVSTFLIKLTAKRFVHTYRKGKNSFVHATVKEDEYKDMILKHMIDFWYAGDVEKLRGKLQRTRIKMYKLEKMIEFLTFEKDENNNEYVGFEINEAGNLVITVKEHDPDYPEAVAELELLESEGEY